MRTDDIRERSVGCVLGLALGDALGAPFEFRRRDEIPAPLPAFERPWLGFPPGSTTDDTAMARILIASLIVQQRLDVADVLGRLRAWLASDPPDVGTFTRRVLSVDAPDDDDVGGAARSVFLERGPEVSAGNGSVMYCAPLGVAYARRSDHLPSLASDLSAITHHDGRCRTACVAVTLAVAGLVRGEPAEAVVRTAVAQTVDREGGEELEFLVAEAGVTRPIDGPDRGFCLFTAGLALRVAVEAPSVEEGLRQVVAFGGDTDTNAAVAGALLGAREGVGGLPIGWLERLVHRDAIRRDGEALATLAASSS